MMQQLDHAYGRGDQERRLTHVISTRALVINARAVHARVLQYTCKTREFVVTTRALMTFTRV